MERNRQLNRQQRLAPAVATANDSTYGLAGGVRASTDEKAFEVARKIRTGQVEINGGAFNVVAPFGGCKQSGVGRELGKYGFEEFLEVKAIQHSQPTNDHA
jgi:aldehyde dehydrogenase (NAD+)